MEVINHMTGNTHTAPKEATETDNYQPFKTVDDAMAFAKAKKMEHFSITHEGKSLYKELNGVVNLDKRGKAETVKPSASSAKPKDAA